MNRIIQVVQHDSTWPQAFQAEKARLVDVFGPILESIHHIGSTSVPGLVAKPVIDILVIVSDDSELGRFDSNMIALGYTPRGECLDAGGTPGRFYFSRTVDGVRTHQVHVCREGHFQIQEFFCFLRFLRERPEIAEAYGRLKTDAVAAGDFRTASYMKRKHAWIRTTIGAATDYYGSACRDPSED